MDMELNKKDLALFRWPFHTTSMRTKLKAPDDYHPWTSTASLHGVPSRSQRVRELLDIGYIKFLRQAQLEASSGKPYDEKAVKRGLWSDCSQGVQRSPFGSFPTLTCSSYLYTYEYDLLLPGTAHMAAQGYPSTASLECFGNISSQCCAARHLMGEAFCLPSAAQALLAAFLLPGAPWWHRS